MGFIAIDFNCAQLIKNKLQTGQNIAPGYLCDYYSLIIDCNYAKRGSFNL